VIEESDDSKERQRLYERTRDELAANARSISESYDRALLTLSSAFLGGSLAFIGEIVDLPIATAKWMLYCAWSLFALTIVLTIASFIYGLHTLETLRDAAERYYIQRKQEAWKVSDSVQRVILHYVSACGITFIVGVLLLVMFVSLNLVKEPSMSHGKSSAPKVEQKTIPTSTFQKPASSSPAGSGSTTQTTPTTSTTAATPQKQGAK